MKTEADVGSAVRCFILEHILPADSGPNDLGDDTELVKRGIVDSINVLRLVDFVEETYDIMIEPEDIYEFTTIRKITGIVHAKRSA